MIDFDIPVNNALCSTHKHLQAVPAAERFILAHAPQEFVVQYLGMEGIIAL